jgi:hypothetical protein
MLMGGDPASAGADAVVAAAVGAVAVVVRCR